MSLLMRFNNFLVSCPLLSCPLLSDKHAGFTNRALVCWFIIGSALGLILTGCDTQKDRSDDIALIYQVIEKRKQAVAQKNIQLYRSQFLAEYDDLGVSANELVAEMEQLFSTNSELTLTYPRTRPVVKMNSARVIHTVIYRFAKNKPPISSKETLLLRKVNGAWYISGGVKLGLLRQ